MKALCYTRPLTIGELKTELTMQELPTPEPAETQLLVRMKASSINIDDIHVAEGTFFGGLSSSSASAEKPSIPGVDVCGTVTKVGTKVTGFAAGDDVVGILMPKPGRGTWAQYCCVEARLAIPKPASYSFEEAAACAIAGKTAANAVTSSKTTAGDVCVVVGASGGIGSTVVQILSKQGVKVTGVCSGKNAEFVTGLGAERIVDYTKSAFGDQLKGVRVDAVIDCVGGLEVEAQGMGILKKSGRFVTLCGPDKYIGETRIGKLGVCRMLAYVGWRALVTLGGPRYIMGGIGSSLTSLQELILNNNIKPPIDRNLTFNETEVKEGVAYIASHRARGKVVITIT